MSDIIEAEQTPADATNATGDLGVRLRRVEGQIRGIARMLEDDRSCEDVITQLLAVRSAMDRVAKEIVHIHFDRCLRNSPPDESWEQISRIFDLLNKIS